MLDSSRSKGLILVAVLALAAVVGGCSPGDVELNGSIFDKLGVGSGSQVANRDPKLSDRQNLVLPPISNACLRLDREQPKKFSPPRHSRSTRNRSGWPLPGKRKRTTTRSAKRQCSKRK